MYPSPLVENPLNSINDSSNYVPFAEGAGVEYHNINESPVVMPDGMVTPNRMYSENGEAILSPSQMADDK